MMERSATKRRSFGPAPGGLGAGAPPDEGLVTVGCGFYTEQLPVAGMAVGEVRRRFRDRFDIDPGSQAFVDGAQVDDNTVLDVGQALNFAKRAGEKGRR
ncbi:MAG: hypothetical protein FJ288_07610 [Planctomycetes bacterium]|nr:hypothetical protein [Planctomycetota bacterium]